MLSVAKLLVLLLVLCYSVVVNALKVLEYVHLILKGFRHLNLRFQDHEANLDLSQKL